MTFRRVLQNPSPRPPTVSPLDPVRVHSIRNSGAARAWPRPNAAAAPTIPHTGSNPYARSNVNPEETATIPTRGGRVRDQGRKEGQGDRGEDGGRWFQKLYPTIPKFRIRRNDGAGR